MCNQEFQDFKAKRILLMLLASFFFIELFGISFASLIVLVDFVIFSLTILNL